MKNTPEIYGLVLSGGKSTRMGTDKGLIAYHGMPQREYLYQLLNQVCKKTFLSVRAEQEKELSEEFNCIVDQDKHKGPLNGILSAHEAHPEVAWLVLACDLPLLDKPALEHLISHRNPEKMATAYATHKSGLPEPLVAIWEPHGMTSAIAYMKEAQSSCARKYLINSEIALVFPKNDEVLYNANSLPEYEFAKTKLQ